MKQKGLLFILANLLATVLQAQTGSFDKISVRSSIKLSDKTITNISTDTSLSSKSDTKLPTEKAVKTYVDNSPGIKRVGTGISKIGDSIYFGGESYDASSYRIKYIDPDYGNDIYASHLSMSQSDLTVGYKGKYAKFDDNGIYMDGGSSQQTITAGIIAVNTDGVGIGHSDGYYNSGIDLQVATDGSISFTKSDIKNGEATRFFLTTDFNGKLVLRNPIPPVQGVLNLNAFSGQASWDVSFGGGRANITITTNTRVSIINSTAGQEGYLLTTVSTPGATIIFPINSYQLKNDVVNGAGNLIGDITKVGFINGSNATGTWLCKFLYDGTNYFWTIYRADTIN